jgi:ABC-type multidrug transport system ATPase subunit
MDKLILDNVTGLVKAGEVTAILGASGAGKTSLLNAISCRVPKSEGVLLANGIPYDYSLFGDFANYVMQSDVLMETLTIRETLMFAADLRLAIPK